MNIKELSTKKEGFTLDIDTEPITEININVGFFVSLTDNDITGKNIDEEFIRICKTANHLKNIGFPYKILVGYWKDKEKEYLDLTLYADDEQIAFNIAQLFKQKAIWDNEKQEGISLNIETCDKVEICL